MNINVRFLGVAPSAAFVGHVELHMRRRCERYKPHITSVIVRIGKAGAPTRLSSRCQVTLRGPDMPSVTIETRSGCDYSAFDVAAEHAMRSLRRHLCRASRPAATSQHVHRGARPFSHGRWIGAPLNAARAGAGLRLQTRHLNEQRPSAQSRSDLSPDATKAAQNIELRSRQRWLSMAEGGRDHG